MSHFLADDQRDALRRHLSTKFPADKLDAAVDDIDFLCGWAATEIKLGASWLRHRRNDVDAVFRDIVWSAYVLRRSLELQRPWRIYGVNWEQLDDWLDIIIEQVPSAHCADSGATTKDKGGRPPLEWRDRLITTVYSFYPPGGAAKTVEGHFEQTIRLLLEYLGAAVEDVHSVILDALKRHPEPAWKEIRP